MSLLCAAAVATADFLRASGFLDTISGAAKRSDKLSDIPLPGWQFVYCRLYQQQLL